MLIGQATVGSGFFHHAVRRPDVLALVAVSAGTLTDQKIAVFAKIVAPRIGPVRRGALVEHQRESVHFAAILGILAAELSGMAAAIAVAPRHERLRFDVAR